MPRTSHQKAPQNNYVVGRKREKKLNLTALIYHIAFQHFNTRKGFLAKDIAEVLTREGIEFSERSVTNSLEYLSGNVSIASHRNELTTKYLKKDIYKDSRGTTYQPRRYYINSNGLIRIKPVEGEGVWKTTNITKSSVKHLSRVTGKNLKLSRF